MTRNFRTFLALITAATVLLGCSLPRGAGMQAEILAGADSDTADFAVYPVTKTMLPKFARWPRTGVVGSYGWLGHNHRADDPVISPGDRVSLSIWDSEENSLLTGPGQKNATLSDMVVAPDGTVFVPYLDMIRIGGLTPLQARKTLQTQLEAIIPSAQVQLKVVPGRRNSVDLVGGVSKPGNYPLPDDHMTVLNLVSLGGGIPPALRNPQVRLVRQGRTYVTSVSRLYANPGLDSILRGDDKVIIEEDKRYFLSLGAAGSEKIVYFEKENISALDAMSLVGGLTDNRADPQGILVLRQYPAKALRQGDAGPGKERSIFTIDLTSADGLFSAGQFQIYPGDLVLVTESPMTSIDTVLGSAGGLGRILVAISKL